MLGSDQEPAAAHVLLLTTNNESKDACMKKTPELMKILVLVAAAYASTSALADTNKPTVVLVHGAFAGSSTWDDGGNPASGD